MKPLNKKEMPKLIALIIIAIAIFGYAIVQFSGVGAPAAADNGKKEDKPKVAASATPTPPPVFDVASLGAPSGGKDPFLPAGAAAPKDVPLAVPGPKIVATPTAPLPPITEKQPNAVFETTPVLPLGGDKAPPTAAVVLPPPPPPDYVVTGIVMGDGTPGSTNIAILRSSGTPATPASGTVVPGGVPSGSTAPVPGNPDRRFVKAGDPVGNGFVVAAVRADGVDLKSGDRRVTLKLGNGTTRAK